MKKWLHWLTHFWAVVSQKGAFVYEYCSVCGQRRAVQVAGRYGCVDERWLAGFGEGMPPTSEKLPALPKGGSGTAPPTGHAFCHPDDVKKRLSALCGAWLAQLEAEDASRPNYSIQGKKFEWAEWRLRIVQSIAEAQRIINGR